MNCEKLHLKQLVSSSWLEKANLWLRLASKPSLCWNFDINYFKKEFISKVLQEYDLNEINEFEQFEKIFKQELTISLNKGNPYDMGLPLSSLLKEKLKINLSFTYKNILNPINSLNDYKNEVLTNQKENLINFSNTQLKEAFDILKKESFYLELKDLILNNFKGESLLDFFIKNEKKLENTHFKDLNYKYLSDKFLLSPNNFNKFDYKSTLNKVNKLFKDSIFKEANKIILQSVFWIDSKIKTKRYSYETALVNFYFICIAVITEKNINEIKDLNSLYNLNKYFFNKDFFESFNINFDYRYWYETWNKEFKMKENFTNFNNYEQLANFLSNLRKKINLPTKELKNPYDIKKISISIVWEQSNKEFYKVEVLSTILNSLLMNWTEIGLFITSWGTSEANKIMIYKNQIKNLYYSFLNLKKIINYFKDKPFEYMKGTYSLLEEFPRASSKDESKLIYNINSFLKTNLIVFSESTINLMKLCKKNKMIVFDLLKPQLDLLLNKNWKITSADLNTIIHELFIVTFPTESFKFLSENIIVSLSKLKKANNNLVGLNNIYHEIISYISNYYNSLKEIEKFKVNSSLKNINKITTYKMWIELKKGYNSFVPFIIEEVKKLNQIFLDNIGLEKEVSNYLLNPEYLDSIIKFTGSIPSFLDKLDEGLERFKLKELEINPNDLYKAIPLKQLEENRTNLDLKSQITEFYKNKKDNLKTLKTFLWTKDSESITEKSEVLNCLKDLLKGNIEKKFNSLEKQYFIDYNKVFETFLILLWNKEKGWLALKPKKMFSKMLVFFNWDNQAFKDKNCFKQRIKGKETEFLNIIKEFHPSLKGFEYDKDWKLLKDEYTFELLKFKIEDVRHPNYWFAGNHSVCCMSFWNQKQFDYMFQKGFSIVNVYYKNKVIANSVIYTANNNNFLIFDNIEIAPNYKFLEKNCGIFNWFLDFSNFISELNEIEFVWLWTSYNDINQELINDILPLSAIGVRSDLSDIDWYVKSIHDLEFKIEVDDVNKKTDFYLDAKYGIYLLKWEKKQAKIKLFKPING